jgi:DNA-binding MarR family transcriptional regulator
VPADAPDSIATERVASPLVVYLLGRLDRVLRQAIDARVRDHGLTVAQYTALSVLSTGTPLSNAQLARRSLVTPQAMHEVLLSLEQRGLVRRAADVANARVLRTKLTARGRRLLETCDPRIDELEDRMLGGFNDDETHTLRALLSRSLTNLRLPVDD